MSISLYNSKLNIFPQLANHCRSIRRKKSVQKVVKFNRNVLYVEKSMNHTPYFHNFQALVKCDLNGER